MRGSLLSREILPFLAMFIFLGVATTVVDIVLHYFDFVWVGRYLGIPGTILILLSFGYSLRKRKKITIGKPLTWLRIHQGLTLTGALMILVHAGIHVYAIIPWLALVAMMINIISGMTGQYLLGRSRRYISEKRKAWEEKGLSDEEIEIRIFWDAAAFDLMKKWRAVHLPITMIFVILSLVHIISIFLFWQWR